jgi:NADH-quinone oxidoreductase subunit N
MHFELPNFVPAIPEIFVLSMACLILVVDLFLTEARRDVGYWLAEGTLVVAAVVTLSLRSVEPVVTFEGSYISDTLADTLKVFVFLSGAVVFLYSREYLRVRGLFKGEYHVLGLFGILGMSILVSAYSLLTVYLGLELLSLSLYAMVAFDRDSPTASEAAMKYFVLGALASGMLLYGMSMLYGVTGHLEISSLSEALSGARMGDLVSVFALVFVMVGIAFKLGAVPFHMWLPDVYEGAPTSVTLYLGSITKIAAFALVIRLLAEGMGALHEEWQDMLVILAVLSMAVGNILAIAQSNIKRMLAYSTISHVGFLLLGILAATPQGYAAAMFYTLVYVLMALGAFGFVILMSGQGYEGDRLDDLKGLNERSPWYAFIMMVLMLSMAGVPPTVGFYAKLAVFYAIIDVGFTWLAAVGVLFSVIGAFYYIRIIKLMYFDEPAGKARALQRNLDMRVAISVNGLLVLGLGIFPAGLTALCAAAFV